MRRTDKQLSTVFCAVACTGLTAFVGGCAIHYFDPSTGTEHLWGFGHFKMKMAAPREGLQAIVRGSVTAGVAVGSLEKQSYFHVGIQRRERMDIVNEDTAVRLEWPSNDLFHVRVGSEFPAEFAPDDTTVENPASEESKP